MKITKGMCWKIDFFFLYDCCLTDKSLILILVCRVKIDDPPPNDGRFPCARKEPGAFGFVKRLCGRDEDARGRRASEDAFRLEFVE